MIALINSVTCRSCVCSSCAIPLDDFEDWDDIKDWKLQSSESTIPIDSSVQENDTTEVQITTFMDELEDATSGMSTMQDSISLSDLTPNVSLNDYLRRPVLLQTYTWSSSDPVGGVSPTLNPWSAFFSNAAVGSRIDNYAYLRCDLKLKVVINASPFLYGALLGVYNPLHTLNEDTIFDTGGAAYDSGTRYLIPLSQRPHMWLYPQDNQGATMTLPFFHDQNYLRVRDITQFTSMGEFKLYTYTPLRSANGVATNSVTVQVFAWAENVHLSGPTVALSLQSKVYCDSANSVPAPPPKRDEYGKKPISEAASIVSKAMSYLTRIPYIGKYARATEMAATAISAGAAAVGYSNPPVIDETVPFMYRSYPPLSTSEIPHTFDKLTLDPKQELTIDPSTVGLDSSDELSIPYLVQKESYLASANWTSAALVDSVLFQCPVTPSLHDIQDRSADPTRAYRVFYQTPMCWVSQLFRFWRGDIIFRFKVVCTRFHKGRLRISFDPLGTTTNNINTVNNLSNLVFTKILDIGTETEVEFRVPYQAATAFLGTRLLSRTATSPPFVVNASTGYVDSPLEFNGHINVKVLNVLSAPVATADVTLLVSVRGAENLQFASPAFDQFTPRTSTQEIFSYWRTQAKETVGEESYMMATDMHIMGNKDSDDDPSRYRVYHGEMIPSLRSLLRRIVFSDVLFPNTIASGNAVITTTFTMTKYPLMPGYKTNALYTANSLIGGAASSCNYASFHPITWVQSAFIGVRGSINWTFSQYGVSDEFATHRITRRTNVSTFTATLPVVLASVPWTATDVPDLARFAVHQIPPGAGGSSAIHQNNQGVMCVSLPNYNETKFVGTSPRYAHNPSAQPRSSGAQFDAYTVQTISDPSAGDLSFWKMIRSCGIGTDYSPLFFLNVPVLFSYTNPTPV